MPNLELILTLIWIVIVLCIIDHNVNKPMRRRIKARKLASKIRKTENK